MLTATAQIHLRALKDDKRLIAKAARATGRRNLTDYILSTVIERAKIDLADHPQISMENGDFRRFLARLDEPPRFLPGLRNLLDRPAVFDPTPAHGVPDRDAVAHPQR
jgi:uncharacterized protein (DUF1778 family)